MSPTKCGRRRCCGRIQHGHCPVRGAVSSHPQLSYSAYARSGGVSGILSEIGRVSIAADFCFSVITGLVPVIQDCEAPSMQQALISPHNSSFEILDTRHSPGMTAGNEAVPVPFTDCRGVVPGIQGFEVRSVPKNRRLPHGRCARRWIPVPSTRLSGSGRGIVTPPTVILGECRVSRVSRLDCAEK